MRRGPLKRATAVAVACAGLLALAGCSGDRDTEEGRRVEAAVKRFALADGPEACGMLTTQALATLYGGRSTDPAAGRRGCLQKSAQFEGERVEITYLRVVRDDEAARATAKTADGSRWFTVSLVKSRDRWLIDSIAQRQRPD